MFRDILWFIVLLFITPIQLYHFNYVLDCFFICEMCRNPSDFSFLS